MMRRTTLLDFLDSDIGSNLWDSQELKLVFKEEVVFYLLMNEYVEIDKLKLIKDSEFTEEVKKYVVEKYATIDGVNYIFIKEKEVGFEDIGLEGITIIVLKDGEISKTKIENDKKGFAFITGGRSMNKSKMALKDFLENKQNEVMRLIEPICHAFQIYNFDYDVDENDRETLILEGQEIACSMNSYEAIIEEVLGYIIVKKYRRYLDDDLRTKLYERIQRSWNKKNKEGE